MTLDKVTLGYAFNATYPPTEKTSLAAKDESESFYHKSAFESVGPTAPESVRNAWMQAAEETGVNGCGITGNGMLSHISQMLVMQMQRRLNGVQNYNNILGNTVDSALQAAKQALYALEHPLDPNQQKSAEVKQQKEKEKEFYGAFIEKLEQLKKNRSRRRKSAENFMVYV